MAPEEELHKRVGRKFTKKRKPLRASSVHYPERLKKRDDEHDDVTAAKDNDPKYMSQTVFGMIAAAGSKVDFHSRFEEESSDSEEEDEGSNVPFTFGEHAAEVPSEDNANEELEAPATRADPGGKRARTAERRGLPPLPKLKLRTPIEKNYMSQSVNLSPKQGSSPRGRAISVTPRDAPVMSKMLEAQAGMSPCELPLDTNFDNSESPADLEGKGSPVSLATRLMEIFGFDKPEEVVSEYPCWLMDMVLLQGYMYITQNHICFYSYLAKKDNIVAKSGHLSKKGKQNPKYTRYWFTLKGDVLSYYADPSKPYFRSGNIDLRYGISASLAEPKEKGKDVKEFFVVTDQRQYHFRADSITSAKEWVKSLQKVIFRSHNDGDSVKVSLPIENIIDVEESPIIGFADTLKIRVVDSDETYAIDEYFFSFFSFGQDAFNVLRTMVDDTAAQKLPQDFLSPSPADDECRSRDNSRVTRTRKPYILRGDSFVDPSAPVLSEAVRATLAPFSPIAGGQASPRASGDWGRRSMDISRKSMDLKTRDFSRASFDQVRRSASSSRNRLSERHNDIQKPSPAPPGSTDSFVHSMENGTESSLPDLSSNGTQASGSQILNRSDVFQSPTIQRIQKSPPRQSERKRQSIDSDRAGSTNTHIKVRPPSRSQTDQSARESQHNSDSGKVERSFSQNNSAPTLQQLVKASAYPLQRAAGFTKYLRSRSKRMSNLLATESMGYVEKVSGMWAGGHKHYGEGEGMMPDDRLEDQEDEDDLGGHGDRFRAHFALPDSEKLRATFFAHFHRVLPLYGKIYISDRRFCFRSLLPGTKTKMVLPLKDIENVDKEKGFRFGYSGLVIVIRGHEELFFDFNSSEVRDDCAVTLFRSLVSVDHLHESGMLTQEDKEGAEVAKDEYRMLQVARQDGHDLHQLQLPKSADEVELDQDAPPISFDDPRASILNFKPTESLRITCLTIGSRGDVQPYIALCKGLLAEGHKPKIATHAEFEPWVRKHGIDFALVDGDPAELMRICVAYGMFTYSFLKEATGKFRGWIDELLKSSWKACQDTDILIESPSAMAGIHIAEALGVPCFRAFTMPWTRTRAYPHAFAVPDHKMGGAYNYMSYVAFDSIFWKLTAGQINRWRKKDLGLRSTSLEKLQPNKVPFLYNFSPSVVVPPLDYSDWIRVTGYWFLDEGTDWTPPEELTDFIAKARADDKKLVYIGFGSITVPDPAALTALVVESVLRADVRCILSKGWSDRLGNKGPTAPEISLPPEIHQIKSAPHDWLFKQTDAAAHHGGAGTTGASLRAGVPTVVKPYFGDQFFFGSRVEDLGVGVYMKRMNVSSFSRALWRATHDDRMIVKAKVLGEQIRKENGVATAIQAIYRDLEYAKTLIKHQSKASDENAGDIADEESWTFIGDESDPELRRRIVEWEPRKSFQIGERRGRHSMDLGA